MVFIFSVSLFGCGSNKNTAKLEEGTYGIEVEGAASYWAMTKYIFKDDGKVYVYSLEQSYEDFIYIYEYKLSNTYEYDYNKKDKKLTFNNITFDVGYKKLTSTLLELVYESKSIEKPPYRVVNANCNELQLQLGSNDEWVIIGTGSNLSTYTIPSAYQSYSITTIKSNAFGLSPNLRTITIPSSIRYIGTNVFNSSSLVITFENAIPCDQDGMLYSTEGVTIKVPSASVEAYKSAWPEYASIIQGY